MDILGIWEQNLHSSSKHAPPAPPRLAAAWDSGTLHCREQVHVNVSLPMGYLSTNIPLCQITSVILIGTRFPLDNIYQHLPFHSIGKLRAAKLLIYPTSWEPEKHRALPPSQEPSSKSCMLLLQRLFLSISLFLSQLPLTGCEMLGLSCCFPSP